MRRSLLRNKTFLKIFSVVTAVVLWAVITYTEDPVINQNFTNIPVTLKGASELEERELMVVNLDELPAFTAKLSGTKRTVMRNFDNVRVEFDVSKVKKAGTVSLKPEYILPQGLSFVKANIESEVLLKVEQVKETEVPVRVEKSGDSKNSETIVEVKPTKGTLKIKCAESVADKIAYATIKADVSKITAATKTTLPVTLEDKDGGEIEPSLVLTDLTKGVEVSENIYKRKTLPVVVKTVGEKADSIGIDVKTVTPKTVDVGIKGDSVPEYVTAEVEPVDGGGAMTAKIAEAEGLYISETAVEIEGSFVPKITKELDVRVEYKNASGQYEAPESVRITAVGTERALSEGNITAQVNLQGAKNGENSIKAEFKTMEDIRILNDYTVLVNVK